jgi:hypothetical protein
MEAIKSAVHLRTAKNMPDREISALFIQKRKSHVFNQDAILSLLLEKNVVSMAVVTLDRYVREMVAIRQ